MATTLRYGPSTARGGHGPTTACPAALCRGAAGLGHLKAHSSPIVNRQAEEARQRLDAPLAEAIHARSPGTVHEHRNTGRGRRDYGSTPATRTTAAGWAAPGPG